MEKTEHFRHQPINKSSHKFFWLAEKTPSNSGRSVGNKDYKNDKFLRIASPGKSNGFVIQMGHLKISLAWKTVDLKAAMPFNLGTGVNKQHSIHFEQFKTSRYSRDIYHNALGNLICILFLYAVLTILKTNRCSCNE